MHDFITRRLNILGHRSEIHANQSLSSLIPTQRHLEHNYVIPQRGPITANTGGLLNMRLVGARPCIYHYGLISGSHGEMYDDGCLLGSCAVSFTLIMKAGSSSVTEVNFYQTIWHNNPGDSHPHYGFLWLHNTSEEKAVWDWQLCTWKLNKTTEETVCLNFERHEIKI
jgi:hypothetical protein